MKWFDDGTIVSTLADKVRGSLDSTDVELDLVLLSVISLIS